MGPFEDLQELTKLENRNSFDVLIVPFNSKGVVELVTDHFQNIQWIQVLGTGVEKLIPQNIEKRDDIIMTNAKSSSAKLLGEFVLLGALYFQKYVHRYHENYKRKEWIVYPEHGCYDRKKALMVGTGSIGQDSARKCKYGLDMEVWGVKRDLKNTAHLDEVMEGVFALEDLESRIGEFDLVVNSLPHIENCVTFTESVIKNMKKGAVFVNVGRGSAVDEEALIKYLLNDHLLGAALDVVANEPATSDRAIYDERLQHKILLTCHCMDNSPYYKVLLGDIVEENLGNYVNDRPLQRVVNKLLKY